MEDSDKGPDVIGLHNEFFNVVCEAFPDLADLHYGLAKSPERPGGLLSVLKRVREGQRLLLDRVAEVAEMSSWPTTTAGLDIGCGLAGTSEYLSKGFGFTMTGLNINGEQAHMARKRLRGIKLPQEVVIIQGDGRLLPFPSDSFDLIVAIEVFFHVSDKDVLMNEVARVLRPGGRFILVDEEWTEPTQVFDLMFYPERGTYRGLAKAAGLEVLSEVDLSEEVTPWMKDYADMASTWSNIIATISIALRGSPLLAWRFARGLTYFNRLILQDIKERGIDVSDVGGWAAIQRLRHYLADSFHNGSASHEIFLMKKPK